MEEEELKIIDYIPVEKIKKNYFPLLIYYYLAKICLSENTPYKFLKEIYGASKHLTTNVNWGIQTHNRC